MLFYILLVLSAFLIILAVIICDSLSAPTVVLAVIISVPSFVSWSSQASDLSNIRNQHLVVAEYQLRVDNLQERLNNFDYPVGALMNADTPVAAIVNSLSHAESKLLAAKESMINSIKDVDARKLGPMSGVINFVGDYKQQEEE
tara:strand:+ start:26 stop:457 length:432 start_codon:yes stop_codon:yes gene_type:complete